jgi:multidrug efflux pump subunit AcrB
MKISDYAVKNYQFTMVIFLMIVALGATTIMNMSRSEDPELHAPQFPIVAIYPGTSPKDMEELIVEPLEREISELEGIKRIKTNISDGVAVLFVEYKYENDVDEKYSELVREVNALRTELPQNIASLEVRRVLPSDVNIIQIALVS